MDIYTLIVGHVLPATVSVFGLIANLLSAIVLCQPEMRSCFTILLLGLTFFDSLFLITALLTFGIFTWFNIQYPSLLRTPLFLGQAGSIYLTLAISLERLVAVRWPLRARAFMTISKSKLIVAGVFVLSILLNIPLILCLSQVIQDDELVTWIYSFNTFLIPFPVLMILNVLIYNSFRKSRRARATLTQQAATNESEASESTITKTLLLIVLVFGICYLPKLLWAIQQSLPKESSVTGTWWYEILNILTAWERVASRINSGVNFFIYFLTGKKFREVFFRICKNVGLGRQVPRNLNNESTISSVQTTVEISMDELKPMEQSC